MPVSVLPLVTYPSSQLRQVSTAIEKFDADIKSKFLQLEASMKHYEGYGIAGVQVGIMLRMFTVDWDLLLEGTRRLNQPTDLKPIGKTLFVANPVIIEKSDEQVVINDGCLSLPGIYSDISRSNYVKMSYFDIDGKMQQVEATGLTAFCLQHEEDHLNGKLFFDYLSVLKRKMLIKKMEKFIANSKGIQ